MVYLTLAITKTQQNDRRSPRSRVSECVPKGCDGRTICCLKIVSGGLTGVGWTRWTKYTHFGTSIHQNLKLEVRLSCFPPVCRVVSICNKTTMIPTHEMDGRNEKMNEKINKKTNEKTNEMTNEMMYERKDKMNYFFGMNPK